MIPLRFWYCFCLCFPVLLQAQFSPVSISSTYGSEFYNQEFKQIGVRELRYTWNFLEVTMEYNPSGKLKTYKLDHYSSQLDTIYGFKTFFEEGKDTTCVYKLLWDFDKGRFMEPFTTEMIRFLYNESGQCIRVDRYRLFSQELEDDLKEKLNRNSEQPDSLAWYVMQNQLYHDQEENKTFLYEYSEEGLLYHEEERNFPRTGFAYSRYVNYDFESNKKGLPEKLKKIEVINGRYVNEYMFSYSYNKEGKIEEISGEKTRKEGETQAVEDLGTYKFIYGTSGLLRKVVNRLTTPKMILKYRLFED